MKLNKKFQLKAERSELNWAKEAQNKPNAKIKSKQTSSCEEEVLNVTQYNNK